MKGPVFVRVLQRNRTNCVCVNRQIDYQSNWLTQLWRLTGPKACSRQAGGPREPIGVVLVLRQEKTDVPASVSSFVGGSATLWYSGLRPIG